MMVASARGCGYTAFSFEGRPMTWRPPSFHAPGLAIGGSMDAVVPAVEAASRVVQLRSGRRLGVIEYGDPAGLAVLALHGAPASRLMFDVADRPARDLGLRLIAFDRPGYGLSPRDYGATLISRTEIFAELPDALGLDRFALLGVSGGAPYAAALAAHMGARITALGLVSPMGPIADVAARSIPDRVPISTAHRVFFLDMPHHPWLLRTQAEVAMLSFRAAPHYFANAFAHLLPEDDRRIIARPDVERSMIAMTLEATRHGIGGSVADLEIYAEPWHVDYQRITAPARLWQATGDTIAPVAVALRLGRLIPTCEVTRIEDAGHFWIYDQVEPTLAALKELAIAGGSSAS